MRGVVEKLNVKIDMAEANPSRTRAYVIESVQAERERVIPTLAAQLQIIRDLAKQTEPEKKFWESRPLLLSLQAFSTIPSNDAVIRMGYAEELATMPPALLNLTMQNARADANLPLVWQCWRAGIGRSNEAGFTDAVNLSIEGLEIPDQAEALAAIATCFSNVSQAETIAAVATGMRIDPVRKMNAARAQAESSRLVSAAVSAATNSERDAA
jgi:hypothetical protein